MISLICVTALSSLILNIVAFSGAASVLAYVKKIQKLHNRTARILFYASNEDDIEELLQALGWLSLLGCTKLDID